VTYDNAPSESKDSNLAKVDLGQVLACPGELPSAAIDERASSLLVSTGVNPQLRLVRCHRTPSRQMPHGAPLGRFGHGFESAMRLHSEATVVQLAVGVGAQHPRVQASLRKGGSASTGLMGRLLASSGIPSDVRCLPQLRWTRMVPLPSIANTATGPDRSRRKVKHELFRWSFGILPLTGVRRGSKFPPGRDSVVLGDAGGQNK